MRNLSRSRSFRPALTLLEMTVVICVLLALMGTGLFVSGQVREWRLGREAGEALRTVYTAQRLYLADHPTTEVSNLKDADGDDENVRQIKAAQREEFLRKLLQYLPGNALPTIRSSEGTDLTIDIHSIPPVIDGHHGDKDPSGNPSDGLWDVGE